MVNVCHVVLKKTKLIKLLLKNVLKMKIRDNLKAQDYILRVRKAMMKQTTTTTKLN